MIKPNKKAKSTNYDQDKMNDLYENGQLKDHIDCKEYILKYFCPTTSGTHILFKDNKPTIIQNDTMKLVYLDRFPTDIAKWYKKCTKPKELISDISKPCITDTFINLAGQIKYKYKKYDTFSEEMKNKVKIFLDYMKLIWSKSNEEVYEYLIKWLVNVVKGNKNKSCIYAKGDEGIGKSTLTEMFRDHVIGRDLYCVGKADHLKGEHNSGLLGKVLVVFEELQLFTDKEWRVVDSELKDLITSDYASYTDKYEKRFTAVNNNNYIVNTNHNAIKSANGRRYFVADINPRKLNDFEYFGNIRNQCFNDSVGQAIYCYLMEIKTDDFNSLNMPQTKAKKDLCADLLSPLEKFLKFNFLLKSTEVNMKLKDFSSQYDEYRYLLKLPPCQSIQFVSKSMSELGFDFKKCNGYNSYKISLESLQELANKKKWIHELDEDEMSKHNIHIHDYDDNKTENELKDELENCKTIIHYLTNILDKNKVPIPIWN